MVRRKPGTLLPLEVALLSAAWEMQQAGAADCYGYALAKALAGDDQARRMISHGTLYKALGRMTTASLLDSWWEDPAVAQGEGRPPRRLYRITGAGSAALADARVAAAETPARRRSSGPASPESATT